MLNRADSIPAWMMSETAKEQGIRNFIQIAFRPNSITSTSRKTTTVLGRSSAAEIPAPQPRSSH